MPRKTVGVTYNGRKYNSLPDGKISGHYFKSRGLLLHREIWKDSVGEIPDGFQIHHVDGDKHNNSVENLECLSFVDHRKRHRGQCSDAQRASLEKIRPLTKEWHASAEGREWHRVHGIEVMKNRKPITHKCENCGNDFEDISHHARFCSNACKSAWRRRSGVDNVKKDCVICGTGFSSNKYSKITTCSYKCRATLGYSNRQK